MRVICYDIETTGKEYQKGHRIVEVAMIEYINGVKGKVLHKYINPERDIPADVVEIHGITNERVANEPRFKDVAQEIAEFMRGAIMVAHNSTFDEKFINHEFELAKLGESFWTIASDTVDNIDLSRKIWRGKNPNNLDAKGNPKNYTHKLDHVLDRLEIDRSNRVLHGALLDSELLGESYFKMKKIIEDMGPTLEDDVKRRAIKRVILTKPISAVNLPTVNLSSNKSNFKV